MNKRTRGAAFLATAAVCASPLLVSAAFAAPIDDLPTTWSRLVLHDTTDPSNGSFIAVDHDLHGSREPDLATAEDEAGSDFFDLPITGTNDGTISNLTTADFVGLDSSATGGIGYTGQNYSTDDDWDVSASGAVKASNGKYLGFDDKTGELALTDTPRYVVTGSSTGTNPVSLVAGVESVDPTNGTALLSGSASSVKRYNATIHIGSDFVVTQDNGTWVMPVSGLNPGKNSVTVEQWIDGVKYDSKTVTIDLSDGSQQRDDLTVDSPSDNGEFTPGTVTYSGHGTPSGHITVKPTSPDETAVETDVKATGEWSVDVPMGDEAYSVTVTQNALGKDDTKTLNLTPVAAGVDKPLSLTSPTKGGQFTAGGPVTWTGEADGSAGGFVTLHSTYPDSSLVPDVTVPVNHDGSWNLTQGMGFGPYVFDIIETDAQGTETDRISGIDILPVGWPGN